MGVAYSLVFMSWANDKPVVTRRISLTESLGALISATVSFEPLFNALYYRRHIHIITSSITLSHCCLGLIMRSI